MSLYFAVQMSHTSQEMGSRLKLCTEHAKKNNTAKEGVKVLYVHLVLIL